MSSSRARRKDVSPGDVLQAIEKLQEAHQLEIRYMQAMLRDQKKAHAEQLEVFRQTALEVATEVSKKAVAEARDTREATRRGIMKRQAKRAGMTLSAWIEHCTRTNHDPMKMDKSIPNHEPLAARGGRPRKHTAANTARALAEKHADITEDIKRRKATKKAK